MSADASIGIMDDEMYDLRLRETGSWAQNVIVVYMCDLLLMPSKRNDRVSYKIMVYVLSANQFTMVCAVKWLERLPHCETGVESCCKLAIQIKECHMEEAPDSVEFDRLWNRSQGSVSPSLG